MMRVALVLMIVFASAAHADRKSAEQHFNRGEKAYRAQKFLAAAQAFEAAYKELPSAPELAFSAAQAYRRQYRVDPDHPEYVEYAIKYYTLYLRDRKQGGRVGDAADSLEDMKAEERHLEKTGKLGKTSDDNAPKLAVSVELADRQQVPTKLHEIDDTKSAEIEIPIKAMIDKDEVPTDELRTVTEGDHVVRAEAKGYKPAEKRVHVIAGVPIYAPLTLEPLPAQLTVATENGAKVVIDGRGVGETPLAAISLAAGKHVVTVLASGRRAVAREISLDRGETKTLTVDLDSTVRRRSVKWVVTGSALFVAAAGTSLGFALYWNGQARDELAHLDDGNQAQSELDAYNTHRTNRDRAVDGVIIAGSAAVVVGVTAVWLYYFDSPSAEGVKVVPMASPTAAGAVISASF